VTQSSRKTVLKEDSSGGDSFQEIEIEFPRETVLTQTVLKRDSSRERQFSRETALQRDSSQRRKFSRKT
jgi:hypothetical protein